MAPALAPALELPSHPLSDRPPPILDAPAPFSRDPDPESDRSPDFILRSCDGVDFYVHKDVLKFVSGVFDDMFTLAARGSGDPGEFWRDGLPVLALTEPNAVLYRLLCLAYPARSLAQFTRAASDLDLLIPVQEAAYKYQFICVQHVMAEMLANPVLLDAYPHRIFAIAQLRGLPELARKAALRTLRLAAAAPIADFPEMRLLTWDSVQKLHNFHHACATAAQRSVEALVIPRLLPGPYHASAIHKRRQHDECFLDYDLTTRLPFIWLRGAHSPKCGPCNLPAVTPAKWFWDHMDWLAGRLRLLPSHHTILQEARNVSAANRQTIDACPACSEHADRDLAIFARQLAVHIEESNKKLAETHI
ncbi:hypothetical protein C8R44DRAFT_663787 [Mycena epipterygia]|nr:hypothetical protein C8R44DRAFT_663787 [Mycena epipterygia]